MQNACIEGSAYLVAALSGHSACTRKDEKTNLQSFGGAHCECRCGKGIFYIVPYQKSTSQPTHRLSHWHNASDPLEWSKSGRVSFPEICQILSAKNRLLTDDPNYIKKKRTKVDPNAPDNEQDQEMNQALVLEVEPALVAEVNEDTFGEQYADECGIPIGSQEFKLMDGSTLF